MSISIRRSIRWGDEEAFENTDTIVLTSGGRNFVDIRSLKPITPETEQQIEWAFSGTSKSTDAEYNGSTLAKPQHTVWSHWLDSKTEEEVKDEGDMYPQPDGTVLEKGSMINPATGIITDYEEIWEDFEPQTLGQDERYVCNVLQCSNPQFKTKGTLMRLGRYIQGVLRKGDEFSAVRCEWIEGETAKDGEWKQTVAVGDGLKYVPYKILQGTTSEVDQQNWVLQEGLVWRSIEK